MVVIAEYLLNWIIVTQALRLGSASEAGVPLHMEEISLQPVPLHMAVGSGCPAPATDTALIDLGPTLAQGAAQLLARGPSEATRILPAASLPQEYLNTASSAVMQWDPADGVARTEVERVREGGRNCSSKP